MYKNFKSEYILEMPFLLLGTHKLLKLLKYNKKFQKRFALNIKNYMEFSGRYIIYENNGIGKEYDTFSDKLLYEGKFLNGERNGKGKEYYCLNNIGNDGEYLAQENYEIENSDKFDGKVKFEGEFKSGKKWEGKGYNEHGNEIYKIENGKGTIREFYENDIPKFQSEYNKGELHGKAKEVYYSESKKEIVKFEGDYLFGNKWNGKGYFIYNNKQIYLIKNGKCFFQEYFTNGDLKFECEFINGEKNGKGKEYYFDNQLKFEGEYLCGKKHGIGTKFNDSGEVIFKGEYLYDLKKKGREYINGRLEYEGDYFLDKKWNGKGYDIDGNIIYEIINGNGEVKEYDNYNGILIFEGRYLNGKRSGKGKEYFCNGKIKYEGEYLNGKKHGNGLEYEKLNGRLLYAGEYENEKKNGAGVEYYYNKKVKYEGNYLNGEKHGKGTEYYPSGKLKFKGE